MEIDKMNECKCYFCLDDIQIDDSKRVYNLYCCKGCYKDLEGGLISLPKYLSEKSLEQVAEVLRLSSSYRKKNKPIEAAFIMKLIGYSETKKLINYKRERIFAKSDQKLYGDLVKEVVEINKEILEDPPILLDQFFGLEFKYTDSDDITTIEEAQPIEKTLTSKKRDASPIDIQPKKKKVKKLKNNTCPYCKVKHETPEELKLHMDSVDKLVCIKKRLESIGFRDSSGVKYLIDQLSRLQGIYDNLSKEEREVISQSFKDAPCTEVLELTSFIKQILEDYFSVRFLVAPVAKVPGVGK